MHALVFADRDGAELTPLNEILCPALLPVRGKPILEHCLEQLRQQGISEIFLVTGDHTKAIRDHFGDGLRWSLKIHYLMSKQSDSPEKIRAYLGDRLPLPYIGVRGDILRTHAHWLANADDLQPKTPGVLVVSDDACDLRPLAWPMLGAADHLATPSRPTNSAHLLRSLAEYHQCALQALQQDAQQLSTAGVADNDNLQAGKQSKMHHRSLASGAASLGDYSTVHSEARLAGRVVIGNHCLIDRGARLHDSIILDNTYVGSGLEIKNAIVAKNHLIRVDLNADFHINDPFLLADNRFHHPIGNISSVIARLLACLVLLLSTPLWPLAALLAWMQNSQPLLTTQTLSGNRVNNSPNGLRRRTFRAYRWHTPIAALNALPLLLCIIRGDINWFGRALPTYPQHPPTNRHQTEGDAHDDVSKAIEERDTSPWISRHQALPIGLWSPAELYSNTRTDPVERQLLEIELLSSPSWKHWLRRLRCFS
ncbi:NDP-sugar synthase [Amphritea sp. 1_MG-2023]|uniref:NDP-sugar synthase n=1 Tax=Amphritea sp. 1_MG-2023 TaxID=3062670 RepID=UPI0026E232AC|nr:NDP-sugar synthase [Amphritea sp. 1_MG-2023]MDO6563770.1 NDP-sugar synthase [Amphritea sp. 1_MG-2023]